MKFPQSQTQFSQLKCKFKFATASCLRQLPCFHCHGPRGHIKVSTEVGRATTNPGVVAKLMGLDSIPVPQNHHSEDRRDLITRSQPISRTPMVLEMENGKFVVLGFEPASKGNVVNSRRNLSEDPGRDDGSKKREEVDFELGILDQLVLELVYIF